MTTRITTSIVLFYVWLSASANLIVETGLADALGIAGVSSAGDSFRGAIDGLSQISGGGLSSESLIGIYVLVGNAAQGFVVALSAGPRLMVNIGIPMAFVVFLHAPIGVLAGRFLIHMLSGRDA